MMKKTPKKNNLKTQERLSVILKTLLDPSEPEKHFARNLAISSTKPVITPNASKRAAKSPAETKEIKKLRGQSLTRIPKKK